MVPIEWPEWQDASSERMVASNNPVLDTVDSESADLYNYWVVDFPQLVERPESEEIHLNGWY